MTASYTVRATEESGRFLVWPLVIERFLQAPFIGVGVSDMYTYIQPKSRDHTTQWFSVYRVGIWHRPARVPRVLLVACSSGSPSCTGRTDGRIPILSSAIALCFSDYHGGQFTFYETLGNRSACDSNSSRRVLIEIAG